MNIKIKNNKGYTIVGTLIVITAVGLMSTAIVDLSSSGTESGNDDTQSIQATHVGGGGLQYAMHQLSYGLSPDTQNESLGNGSFTITSNPAAQLVTVASAVGKAKKTQAITTTFSNNKAGLNINNGAVSNKSITGLTLDKDTGKQIVLTGFTVDWNWNNCDANLSCEGNDQQVICHVPPGNSNNKHTISASPASHPAHLAHGDYLGPCNPGDTVPAATCEGTLQQMLSCDVDTGNNKLKKISFNGTSVFSGNADPNQLVSINPYYLMLNQSYPVDDIEFSGNLPNTGWYSLTLHFADGSTYTKTFKFTSNGNGNNGNDNNGNGNDNGNNGNNGNNQ